MRDLMDQFETVSAAYAETYGIERNSDWFLLKLLEETGELTQAANRVSGRARPKGRSAENLRLALADETADLLGHILLFARHHDIDLDAAIERKWRFKPAE